MHIPVSRRDIAGVWRRVLLVDGEGVEDRDSVVYWLQGTRLCGDIRQHRRLSTLTGPRRQGDLPCMDAFAGELIEAGAAFRWDASIRLAADDGPPDEGRLAWLDGDLREDGVHRAYVERWTRVAPMRPGDCAVALRDPARGTRAYWLRIGGYVFCGTDGAGTPAGPAFSLFMTDGGAARLVLSTASPRHAACRELAFADAGRRTAWLRAPDADPAGDAPLWDVSARDACEGSSG